MSNVLNAAVIKVDTAFSSKYSAQAGALVNNVFYIDEIYWYNPVNVGDTVTVTLGDGNTVIRQARCEVANQSQLFKMYGIRVVDFQVPTLSSGTLYIYYHQ